MAEAKEAKGRVEHKETVEIDPVLAGFIKEILTLDQMPNIHPYDYELVLEEMGRATADLRQGIADKKQAANGKAAVLSMLLFLQDVVQNYRISYLKYHDALPLLSLSVACAHYLKKLQADELLYQQQLENCILIMKKRNSVNQLGFADQIMQDVLAMILRSNDKRVEKIAKTLQSELQHIAQQLTKSKGVISADLQKMLKEFFAIISDHDVLFPVVINAIGSLKLKSKERMKKNIEAHAGLQKLLPQTQLDVALRYKITTGKTNLKDFDSNNTVDEHKTIAQAAVVLQDQQTKQQVEQKAILERQIYCVRGLKQGKIVVDEFEAQNFPVDIWISAMGRIKGCSSFVQLDQSVQKSIPLLMNDLQDIKNLKVAIVKQAGDQKRAAEPKLAADFEGRVYGFLDGFQLVHDTKDDVSRKHLNNVLDGIIRAIEKELTALEYHAENMRARHS